MIEIAFIQEFEKKQNDPVDPLDNILYIKTG